MNVMLAGRAITKKREIKDRRKQLIQKINQRRLRAITWMGAIAKFPILNFFFLILGSPI